MKRADLLYGREVNKEGVFKVQTGGYRKPSSLTTLTKKAAIIS